MRKKAYIYINYGNIVVLQSYLDVVKESLQKLGYECTYVKSIDGVNKKDLLVVPVPMDALKFFLKGYHNYILWQQGATADESFMRNHNRLRYWILNKMDIFAMKKAKAVLYVSDFMKNHYEEIGKCSFAEKSYIMPCFNEEFDPTVYNNKNYAKKIFTYVGSLEPWQCFDETATLYKKIEDSVSGVFFKVLTFDTKGAEKILKEKGVKNYEVKCVPKDEVKNELLPVSYGFIIREDNMVNRVATPTKISSYMAAGVIPIFSSCLTDFAIQAQRMNYAKQINNLSDESIQEIIRFVKEPIDGDSIKREYEGVFNTYYSTELHREKLAELLSQCL